MVALAMWRDARCHRCGGDLTETTDEANSGEFDATAKYQILTPVRCYRCTALSISEEKTVKSWHPHALIHRVDLQPRRLRKPK